MTPDAPYWARPGDQRGLWWPKMARRSRPEAKPRVQEPYHRWCPGSTAHAARHTSLCRVACVGCSLLTKADGPELADSTSCWRSGRFRRRRTSPPLRLPHVNVGCVVPHEEGDAHIRVGRADGDGKLLRIVHSPDKFVVRSQSGAGLLMTAQMGSQTPHASRLAQELRNICRRPERKGDLWSGFWRAVGC